MSQPVTWSYWHRLSLASPAEATGGNGGNEGSGHGPEGPCSYQDFLKMHPPMFTPSAKPLDSEHWLRILEQKFLLLNVTDEQKVRFVAQQLLGSMSAWWDTFNAM